MDLGCLQDVGKGREQERKLTFMRPNEVTKYSWGALSEAKR
jgi:hypothetical protein